jgi:hypothetical protein
MLTAAKDAQEAGPDDGPPIRRLAAGAPSQVTVYLFPGIRRVTLWRPGGSG